MSERLHCPAPEDYRRILSGDVTPEECGRLTDHLDVCAFCAGAVQILNDESALLNAVKEANQALTTRPTRAIGEFENGEGDSVALAGVAPPRDSRDQAREKAWIERLKLSNPFASPREKNLSTRGDVPFSCPSCGARLKCKSDALGRKVQCPKCSRVVQAPLAPSSGPRLAECSPSNHCDDIPADESSASDLVPPHDHSASEGSAESSAADVSIPDDAGSDVALPGDRTKVASTDENSAGTITGADSSSMKHEERTLGNVESGVEHTGTFFSDADSGNDVVPDDKGDSAGVETSAESPGGAGSGAGGGRARTSAARQVSGNARFRILRQHARGGLGEVFVARDQELNRDVALKQIQVPLADSEENQARFLLEAEITGRLEHPGIVPVYGLSHDRHGRPYYAMRFIEGDSLKDAIARFHNASKDRSDRENLLEFRQLLSRFQSVCNTIAYAHSRDVIHRDLKPANVMLGPYGETLVVDWGLAKHLGDRDPNSPQGEDGAGDDSAMTRMGAILGTPTYMSPEQASGKLSTLGPESDIFSLGATLYCLLTGSSPYHDTSVDRVLDRARRCDFAPPKQLASWVPAALQAVCLKAMSREPADRYATATELSGDLERWLGDEPVSAYREPFSHRFVRWSRRHRTLVTSVLLLTFFAFVAVSVSGVLLTIEQGRTKRENDKYRSENEKYKNEQIAKSKEEEEKRQAMQREERVRNYMFQVLGSPDPEKHADARTIPIGEILDTAVAKVEVDFRDDPEAKAEILGQLARTYYNLGVSDKARTVYRQSWAILGQHSQPTLLAQKVRNGLAVVSRELGTPGESIELLESMPSTPPGTTKDGQGKEWLAWLNGQTQLALAYQAVGRDDDAMKLLVKLRDLSRQHQGEDPATLRIQALLASCHLRQGDMKTAEQLAKAALDGLNKHLGPRHADTLLAQYMVGSVLFNQGEYVSSIKVLQDNWKARERILGIARRDTLLSMELLARAYLKKGQLTEAVSSLERAWRYWKQTLGETHADTLASWNYLTEAYSRGGREEPLRSMLEEFLQTRAKDLGPSHEYVILARARLGWLLEQKAQIREAIPLWENAFARMKENPANFADDLPRIRNSLLRAYEIVEDDTKADQLLGDMLDNMRRENSGDVAKDQLRLAGHLAKIGEHRLKARKFVDAEIVCRECLALRRRHAPDSWLTFNAASLLGASLTGQKKFAEAEKLLVEGYEGIKIRADKIPPIAQQRLPEAMGRLIDLYTALGQEEQAQQYRSQLAMARTSNIEIILGKLSPNDKHGPYSTRRDSIHAVHVLEFEKGQTYLIELATCFETQLCIEELSQRKLFDNINRTEHLGLSSALFMPPRTGKYRIVVAPRNNGDGHYMLTRTRLTPALGNKNFQGKLDDKSPIFRGQPTQMLPLPMKQDRLYFIEAIHSSYDPQLLLLDPTSTRVLETRNRQQFYQPTNLTQIVFRPRTSATYHAAIRTYDGNHGGPFELHMHAFYWPAPSADKLEELGHGYLKVGQLALAVPCFELAWSSRKRELGAAHPKTLADANWLGSTYVALGNTVDALPVFREILDTVKQKSSSNVELFQAHVHHGAVALARGQFGRALADFEAAKKYIPKSLPDDMPFLIVPLDEDIADADADTAEAITKAVRYLEKKTSLPSFHPMAFTLEAARTLQLCRSGDYTMSGVQPLLNEQFGRSHPYFLNWNWNRYFRYQAEENRRKMRECIHGAQRSFGICYGHNDPRTLDAWAKDIKNSLDEGNVNTLEKETGLLLANCNLYVPDHWLRYWALALHGRMLAGTKKYQKAESALLEAHAGLMKLADQLPPSRRTLIEQTHHDIIALYVAWGQLDKAEQWKRKIEKLPAIE